MVRTVVPVLTLRAAGSRLDTTASRLLFEMLKLMLVPETGTPGDAACSTSNFGAGSEAVREDPALTQR